jgi:hypothetical protein
MDFQFHLYLSGANGESVLECIAAFNDFELATASFRAALTRWPHSQVILRQGSRTVQHSGPRAPR